MANRIRRCGRELLISCSAYCFQTWGKLSHARAGRSDASSDPSPAESDPYIAFSGSGARGGGASYSLVRGFANKETCMTRAFLDAARCQLNVQFREASKLEYTWLLLTVLLMSLRAASAQAVRLLSSVLSAGFALAR